MGKLLSGELSCPCDRSCFVTAFKHLIVFQSVNNLSIETRKVVKGNHSRKTANFVRVKQKSIDALTNNKNRSK